MSKELANQAAANKAAEEGGLPEMPRNYGRFNINGPDEHRIRGWTGEQMKDYALKAIEADRASRQVANKAEVEPVAYLDLAKLAVGGMVYATSFRVNDKQVALCATPPATTGASTVDLRNDEVFDELLGDYGDSFGKLTGNIDPEPIYQYIEQAYAKVGASTARDQALEEAARLSEEMSESGEGGAGTKEAAARIRALKGSVGASTVLTDERIKKLWHGMNTCDYQDFARAIEREVAAQAGQVAVPEGWKLVPIKPTIEMIEAFDSQLEGACGSYFDWDRGGDEAYAAMLAAAPSPAKESK